jgi:hypothetical protein
VPAVPAARADRLPIPWIWIAAIWFAGALLDASQSVFQLHAEGRQTPLFPVFAVEFVGWLPWALATPFVAGLVRDQRGEAAVGMIVGLCGFLRRASEDSHRPQVTPAEEVQYLQRY